MNAIQITDGGHISTTTFWEVAIPLVVASIIIPVAFSGLLVRMAVKVIRSSYRKWLRWRPFSIAMILMVFNIGSAVVGGRPLFWVVWTLNLLYTLTFLTRTWGIYQDLQLASSRVKDAIVARRAYTLTGPRTARDSNTSRGSRETESSWATVNSSVSERSWATAREGSSIASSSNTSFYEAKTLRKQVTKAVLLAFVICCQAAITVGGLGLGTAFLTLDIFYPKARGLSVYHSFALWMSLASVIYVTAWKSSRYMWRRAQIIYESYEARTSVSRRRRRGSNASQSEGNGRTASDGAV